MLVFLLAISLVLVSNGSGMLLKRTDSIREGVSWDSKGIPTYQQRTVSVGREGVLMMRIVETRFVREAVIRSVKTGWVNLKELNEALDADNPP